MSETAPRPAAKREPAGHDHRALSIRRVPTLIAHNRSQASDSAASRRFSTPRRPIHRFAAREPGGCRNAGHVRFWQGRASRSSYGPLMDGENHAWMRSPAQPFDAGHSRERGREPNPASALHRRCQTVAGVITANPPSADFKICNSRTAHRSQLAGRLNRFAAFQ
jgi:hypothetical protein